jgi:hypothetical protein
MIRFPARLSARLLLGLLALLCLAPALHAQMQVSLTLKRRLYMAYEPIIATVSITNLSGRDVPLTDADGQHWFSFNILNSDGIPLAPSDADYKLSDLTIPAGQTVKRSITLNTLYPVHDYGTYRIRAAIYFAPLQKFFESKLSSFEISEGRALWQQVVGIPDGEPNAGALRRVSLLSFRHPEANYVYVRIEDNDTGTVFCASPLGRLLDNMQPQVELDALNRLHILQPYAAKSYLYTQVNLDGSIGSRRNYLSGERTRPVLKRDASGDVAVLGGTEQTTPDNTGGSGDSGTAPASQSEAPKLSDRPVALPAN